MAKDCERIDVFDRRFLRTIMGILLRGHVGNAVLFMTLWISYEEVKEYTTAKCDPVRKMVVQMNLYQCHGKQVPEGTLLFLF